MRNLIIGGSVLLLASLAAWGQASGQKCKITIVNQTPNKLILHTRNHQFTINPGRQMSGKQACADLQNIGNPLAGTGYKVKSDFSPERKAATAIVTGSQPSKCGCFNLVEPNRICIPCGQ